MIVFLLEEPSMCAFLEGILPQIIGGEEYRLIPHEGKGDLIKSIPNKLKGWNIPDTKFVIVHDQDTNDCVELKNRILQICSPYKRDVLVRIACRELEAWYFGDLHAVETVYNKELKKLCNSKKYSVPDLIVDPKETLQKYVPELTQIDGARKISRIIDIENNKSHSFQVFVDGVKRFSDVRGK